MESVLLFSNHEFHLKVPKTSGCIDIPFNQLHLRNQTGATVSRIVRKDGTKLNNPGANASFQAEDDVYFHIDLVADTVQAVSTDSAKWASSDFEKTDAQSVWTSMPETVLTETKP